jgi:hypothetical protein
MRQKLIKSPKYLSFKVGLCEIEFFIIKWNYGSLFKGWDYWTIFISPLKLVIRFTKAPF